MLLVIERELFGEHVLRDRHAQEVARQLRKTRGADQRVGMGEQLAYGVYYGGFLVLVLYNFFIFLAVMAFNLVGDALRDALDPKRAKH